jgi:hypothetical protein
MGGSYAHLVMQLDRAAQTQGLLTMTDPTFTERQQSGQASGLALRLQVRKIRQRAVVAIPPHFMLGIGAESAYVDSACSVLWRTAVVMRVLSSPAQKIILPQER